MGEHGGAVLVQNPVSPSEYSKNPEDYYSSTSCVNCHSPVPKNEKISGADGFYLRPSPCPAEMQWPSYLQTPIRNIETYPWWIHQNYLFTRMQKETPPVLPKKLDLGLTLFMKNGVTVPLSNDLELRTRENSSISFKPIPSGQGQDFSLLLENQTLFQTENISAHLPRWYDFIIPTNLIQTLAIRDGHPIVTAAVGALNLFRSRSNPLFSEFDILGQVLPQLPVAFHTKTGKTVNWQEFQALGVTEARKYHRIEVLFEAARSGRIPGRLRLDDLYHLVRDFQESSQKAKESGVPPADFSKLAALISSIRLTVGLTPDEVNHPGVYMKFKDVGDLNNVQLDLETQGIEGIQSLKARGSLMMEEIFLPGFANLGESKLDFQYQTDASGNTVMGLTKIRSQIKPTDLFKGDPRKLGLIQLKDGFIEDGGPVKFQGIDFPAGFHATSSPAGDLTLQVNLNVDATATLPLFGDVRIKGPLLFKGSYKKVEIEKKGPSGEVSRETEYRMVPESTVLSLAGGEITGGGLPPFKVRGDLLLTDMAALKKPTLLPESPGFLATLNAAQIEYGQFEKGSLEFSIPLPKQSDGLYAPFGDYADRPELKGALRIFEKDKTQIWGSTNLSTQVSGKEKTNRLEISLEHRDETGTKVIDPLIEQGFLTLLKNGAAPAPRYDLDFAARSVWLDPVAVVQPQFHLGLTNHPVDNGGFDWTIHGLKLAGNPWSVKRPTRGILQGPFAIKTVPSKEECRIQYDSFSDHLDLRNIKISLNFINVVPPGLREATKRKITGIDVDGHLYGNWSMDTGNYKGKGYIEFRGDKEGDLIFRGKDGRRVEGRLNPDDPDRLYEIPFFADSTLNFQRMDGIDFNRKRVKAPAIFTSLVDWMALQAFGIQWNEHDRVKLQFDYLPYTMEGLTEYFQNRALFNYSPPPVKGTQP